MRNPIDNGVLELEKPGYPWQIIEGHGVTWLILRQKVKIEKKINELTGVNLDNFNWRVKNICSDEHCILGDVALTAKYRATDIDTEEIGFIEEGEAEECGRELFTKPSKNINEIIKAETKWGREEGAETSIFPSLLIDKITCKKREVNEPIAGECYWRLELPWQVKLLGSGKIKEPRIEKIHLGQIGLSTLLFEVLLKFDIEDTIPSNESRGLNHLFPLRGEKILNIEDDTILEVMEVIQQRGFYSGLVDSEAKSLTIKNEMKTSIIYVSSQAGGERFMVASCFDHEENKIIGLSSFSIPPIGYYLSKHDLKVNKIDMKKIICRYEQWCGMLYEYLEDDIDSNNSHEKLDANYSASSRQLEAPITIIRKKPGERWMKKSGSAKSEIMTEKLVITIKK
ncbi:MAG: hypothetical protein CVU87_06040 [Firmicutes bacterium HGW-Firmicutes-12]|nr:MAG: hypothetical protein CVU87_06040 [Firmicutes bacterium HGW-Firmicutes-12]